jgi:hypothetical protein
MRNWLTSADGVGMFGDDEQWVGYQSFGPHLDCWSILFAEAGKGSGILWFGIDTNCAPVWQSQSDDWNYFIDIS